MLLCVWGYTVVMNARVVRVEVLYALGCDSWPTVRDAVLRAAAEASIRISVHERLVRTRSKAEALRFPGSPTVRVAGRDLQPEIEAIGDYGLG